MRRSTPKAAGLLCGSRRQTSVLTQESAEVCHATCQASEVAGRTDVPSELITGRRANIDTARRLCIERGSVLASARVMVMRVVVIDTASWCSGRIGAVAGSDLRVRALSLLPMQNIAETQRYPVGEPIRYSVLTLLPKRIIVLAAAMIGEFT
jgi:hypothetical protein